MDLDQNGQAMARREIVLTRSLLSCPWLSADGKLAVLATNQFSAEMCFGLLAVQVDSGEVIATL